MSKLYKAFLLLGTILICINAKAQQFTPKALSGAENLLNAKMVWADFNKNDSLEVLITGVDSNGAHKAYVIKNTWIANPEIIPLDINVLVKGNINASDIDHDGIPEVLMTGKDHSGKPQTLILFSDNNFNFSEKSILLEGLYAGNSIIADFNNDGKKDIFINGKNANDIPQSLIYKNSGSSFKPEPSDLIGLSNGAALVLDFNKDGFADLFLTGTDKEGNKRSILYQNEREFQI